VTLQCKGCARTDVPKVHRPGSSGTELRNCLRTIAHADPHGVCARTTAPPSTKASTAGRRGTHPAPQLCRGTSANKNNVPAASGTWLFQFRNRDSKSALHCVLIEYVAARRCFQLILIHLDTIHSLTTEIFVLGTPQLQFLNLLNPASNEGSVPTAKPSTGLSSPNPRTQSDPMDGRRVRGACCRHIRIACLPTRCSASSKSATFCEHTEPPLGNTESRFRSLGSRGDRPTTCLNVRGRSGGIEHRCLGMHMHLTSCAQFQNWNSRTGIQVQAVHPPRGLSGTQY